MKYFSNKVATDHVFCDRNNERAALIRNINNNEHTVIVAPRRYGKTSLALRAIEESGLPSTNIDLFCVVFEDEVTRKLAKGVTDITTQLLSRTEKTLQFLEGVFKSASIGLKAGGFDVSVDISQKVSSVEYIEDLLTGLEKIAANSEQPVVFFIDEFQDVLKIENSTKIQAAIRTVAQHSKYVTYIFSGSSRAMLEKIFENSNQPLFMMCEKMLLGRISQEDLTQHIQSASFSKWMAPLPQPVIQSILDLSECHTYYVNALCRDIFELDSMPTLEQVHYTWEQFLVKYQGKITAELEKLNTNRLKVLVNVALEGEIFEPSSRRFLEKNKLTLSSTQVAIGYLLENDYLYKTGIGSLKVIDPLIKTFLQNKYSPNGSGISSKARYNSEILSE